ncbi:phospholipase D [Gautieria morchelliformis]|nr:phospholipase D [Gautieria morchelliformis]
MDLFKKIGEFVEHAPALVDEGIDHAAASLEGLLNPDRRHDDPVEKAQDRMRTAINNSHRFQSFAAQRPANFVKWHIDGHDFFYAVSEMLDSAREVIMILDWWLTPELYLRRPPAFHPEWRLDRLLKRKADQGVKVYIVVYKEVTQTMNMSSSHTKKALEALSPNIAVMRHPDHIGSKDDVEFWSHHEKVVIVDNHRASIGGLDLCFGRWDSHNHPLADVHPTAFARTLFPGQDYNNSRILDFQHVDEYVSNQLDILEAARMPWHDVHMTILGPSVLDIVQHFTERWNEIKKRKYKDDPRYDWLALPHDVENAPNEAVARHPHREQWAAMGRRFQQQWHSPSPADTLARLSLGGNAPHGHGAMAMKVQVVRSVSDWSHGVLTEKSIQNAYLQLIQSANHYIYIENQFFISNTQESGPVKNLIAKALVERILRAARDGQRFKVVVVIPEVPGFAGDISDESAIKIILAAQWRTINRGGHSIYEEIKASGFDPMDYIRFYHLRSYDRINAPYSSYIAMMEKNSGVTFHEAQVALARLWLGPSYGMPDVQTTVAIKLPQPSSEGIVESSKEANKKVEAVAMPKTVEEAKDILARFERGARGLRGDEGVEDSVAGHVLRERTGLLDERWEGTPEEERNAYVSELLYIHSKVMIVDDRRVIMGSANLNDRSQKGDGDSEIALVVEDTDEIESRMDGRRHLATRFAATLRRKLYREHLGLIPAQPVASSHEPVDSFMRPAPHPNADETIHRSDALVADPLSDEVLSLWEGTAKKNRDIFTEVFRPVPSDLVQNWEVYKKYVPKVKAGHVVPEMSLDRVKKQLSQVRGQLVEMPLRFLIDEKELVDNADWKGLNPTLPIYI